MKEIIEVEQLAHLTRMRQLWENPDFQELIVKPLREEMEGLKDLPWALDAEETPGQLRALESCGLKPPATVEDLYRVFLATKSVVHYVQGNLRRWESQSQRSYAVEKRIAEEQAEEAELEKELKRGAKHGW